MPFSSLSPEQLRALVQDTSAFTWSTSGDRDGTPSPQWMALTGQSVAAATGDGWLDAVHVEDRERVRAAWATAVAHGQTYNTDGRVLSAEGVYRWYNLRGVPVRRVDGSIDHWVGLCLEIPGSARFQDNVVGHGSIGRDLMMPPFAIRAARAMLNWSANDLAERSGLSVSTIARLEQDGGTTKPRKANAIRLTQAFAEAGIGFLAEDGSICGLKWRRKT